MTAKTNIERLCQTLSSNHGPNKASSAVQWPWQWNATLTNRLCDITQKQADLSSAQHTVVMNYRLGTCHLRDIELHRVHLLH